LNSDPLPPPPFRAAYWLHWLARMKTIALCLCLSLAAAGVARADQDLIVSPASHADAYRRARAEIIAGAVIMALSTVGVIVGVAFLSNLGACNQSSSDACAPITGLVGVSSGVGALVEGAVGLPLFIDGWARKADARVRFLPVAGPSTVGAGLRLEF
jgi:hypothetical protein